MKIKRKFWFVFWSVAYIASAILFYFILQMGPSGVFVLFFEGLCVVWQLELTEKQLTKWALILSGGINIGLFIVSLLVISALNDGDVGAIAGGILIAAALIAVPTILICRIVSKADKSDIVYSPEEVTKRPRRGFFVSNWGIELTLCCLPALSLIFMDVSRVFQLAVPMGSFSIGMIMLFIGRTQVGLMTRYINFCNRKRTELEEWVLYEMQGIEGAAMHANVINAITKATPGISDDMLAAINSKGVISGFMDVSRVYTGKNVLKNHWPILGIMLIIVVAAIITFIR